MAILLTGGAGYIGSHTAVELLEAGYEVVIADNFSNSCPKVVERVKEISCKDVKLYNTDVRDRKAFSRVFTENDIEAVIHFAGFKAVGESVHMPLLYYRNNIDCTLSLLECMRDFGVQKLIFSSSATVYGPEAEIPYYEDMKAGPCTNPYGWTKLFIEQIITDFEKAHSGFSAVILRYFNPVGAHPSGKIGEDPKGIPNNLMPYVAKVAQGIYPNLKIFGDDYPTKDGTGVRDYIHVVDLAKGHVFALRYAEKHNGIEFFNLGRGEGYSVLDVIHAFSKACGKEIAYQVVERRSGDLAEYYADVSKAKEILGWKAERPLDEMCADAWNWQKNNPRGYSDEEK